MNDIAGSIVNEGDWVFVLAAVKAGSKSKRLLSGTVQLITGKTAAVWINEGRRTVNVTSASIVRPLE